jgi:hypothetical protein
VDTAMTHEIDEIMYEAFSAELIMATSKNILVT